jgi:dextranase
VTRAQFVAMLARVLRLAAPPNGAAAPFTDVPAGAWYARYVAAAWAAGWIQGVSPTAFAPGSPVSREVMAVLVARALGVGGIAALPWADAADVAPWAVAGVRAASVAGYLRGYPDGTFRPAADATRAEAAALLARVLAREAP